jgi:predicted metalloenzyme YecM
MAFAGRLLIESMVGGRPIATYKLHQAIPLINGKVIDVLEVPSPKKGSFYKRGLEHIEIVVPFELEGFISAQQNECIEWDLNGMLGVDTSISLLKSVYLSRHV